MARLTGLEPATSGVTGRHSNQLSYNRPLPADLHQREVLLGTGSHVVKTRSRTNHRFSQEGGHNILWAGKPDSIRRCDYHKNPLI